jgi:hypothetical protein
MQGFRDLFILSFKKFLIIALSLLDHNYGGGGELSDYRTIELHIRYRTRDPNYQTIRLSDIGLQKYFRFPSSE